MRRVAAVLIAVMMCAGYTFAQSNGLPQWKVVKEFHVVGGSNAIPQTVIFTAEKDDVYRIFSLASSHADQRSDNTYFDPIWIWTDRAGNDTEHGFNICFSQSCSRNDIEDYHVFSPKVGTSVSFVLLVSDPPPPTATYDVVFTIEQLTH